MITNRNMPAIQSLSYMVVILLSIVPKLEVHDGYIQQPFGRIIITITLCPLCHIKKTPIFLPVMRT